MNYRINMKVISLVILLVLVAVALFVYTLVSAPADVENIVENENMTSVVVEEHMLTAKHQYLEGVHTVAGKTEVPTLCHRLVSESFFIKEDQSEVEMRFNTLLEGEECTNQLFEVPFRVSFEASEDVSISATWNGEPVRLNLIPLQSGETLDDEIYIKG